VMNPVANASERLGWNDTTAHFSDSIMLPDYSPSCVTI